MKKRIISLLFVAFIVFSVSSPVYAYVVKYKEDWYKLYHVHYQQYPDDCIENIYWLEKAVQADFCNPLFVDIKITTEKEWEKYRYLFQMHINLKLIEQHLRAGRTFDKKCIYFYDAPWKEEYGYKVDLEAVNEGQSKFEKLSELNDYQDQFKTSLKVAGMNKGDEKEIKFRLLHTNSNKEAFVYTIKVKMED